MMASQRAARAVVDLDAVTHNVSVLRAGLGESELWAVVKANGYGHGAVEVARAAIAGGATRLCVALAAEAAELRAAGIAAPIIVLSEQPNGQLAELVAANIELVAYSHSYLDALVGAGGANVHLHIDSGMSRVGAHPDDAVGLARRVAAEPTLQLTGVMTHLACADEPELDATAQQLEVFNRVLAAINAAGIDPGYVHAANSAAAIAAPEAHFDAARVGIAMYGIAPGPQLAARCGELRPALSLVAVVSFVKDVEAGTQVSYGWRHRCNTPTRLATVPAGYADGVARRLGTGSHGAPGHDVLIGGRRCPIVGVVTMDQFVVDVGDAPVEVGDEVVLIGEQGSERITASDWAHHLDTIGYEVVCAISNRVPREPGGIAP